MTSLFAQNLDMLWAQETTLGDLRERFSSLVAGDFHANDFRQKLSRPHQNQEEYDELRKGALDKDGDIEAAFQLQIVVNALEKVSVALRIVSAQQTLRLAMTPEELPEIETCILEDEKQMMLLFRKAGESIGKMRDSEEFNHARMYKNMDDEINAYIVPLYKSIAEDVSNYGDQNLDPSLRFMTRDELIVDIANHRLEATQIVLASNALHMDNIDAKLASVDRIEKAYAQKITPRRNAEMIAEKISSIESKLPRVAERLGAAKTYLSLVFEMDSEGYDPRDFTPRCYVTAPLPKIFDNTP